MAQTQQTDVVDYLNELYFLFVEQQVQINKLRLDLQVIAQAEQNVQDLVEVMKKSVENCLKNKL